MKPAAIVFTTHGPLTLAHLMEKAGKAGSPPPPRFEHITPNEALLMHLQPGDPQVTRLLAHISHGQG